LGKADYIRAVIEHEAITPRFNMAYIDGRSISTFRRLSGLLKQRDRAISGTDRRAVRGTASDVFDDMQVVEAAMIHPSQKAIFKRHKLSYCSKIAPQGLNREGK
jgi:hypothetical protein